MNSVPGNNHQNSPFLNYFLAVVDLLVPVINSKVTIYSNYIKNLMYIWS